MFMHRIEIDDAYDRWRDILTTDEEWEYLLGFMGMRRHDGADDKIALDEDNPADDLVFQGGEYVSKFKLVYPFYATFEAKPDDADALNYMQWLGWILKRDYQRMGTLLFQCSTEDEDENKISQFEAFAVGFSRKADLADFLAKFDGVDLTNHPTLSPVEFAKA